MDKIGNWSSIIGLVISITTLFFAFFIDKKVAKIKKKVMFNTRVTPLLNDLKSYTDNIFSLYKHFDENKNELKVELAKCRVQIESVIPKLPNNQKEEFESIIPQLNVIQNSRLGVKPDNFKQKWYQKKIIFRSEEDIWNLYVALIACVNKLDNLIKDKTII